MQQEPPCVRIRAGLQNIAQSCSRGPEAGHPVFGPGLNPAQANLRISLDYN